MDSFYQWRPNNANAVVKMQKVKLETIHNNQAPAEIILDERNNIWRRLPKLFWCPDIANKVIKEVESL